jgi:hypothetical protein
VNELWLIICQSDKFENFLITFYQLKTRDKKPTVTFSKNETLSFLIVSAVCCLRDMYNRIRANDSVSYLWGSSSLRTFLVARRLFNKGDK